MSDKDVIAGRLELRPIGEPDMQRVREIFVAAFEVPSPPPLEYISNLCCTEPEGCLVGLVDGAIVGYATSHRSGRIGYIGNLAVEPSHRRRGYARALTLAVRDHLMNECDVIGLSVEPNLGGNLELYSACGFDACLPSAQLWKQKSKVEGRELHESVRTAQQLASRWDTISGRLRAWQGELLPGLDFERDLALFAEKYPDRLWVHFEEEEPTGFLAYHSDFRGDLWGAVRPGALEHEALGRLLDAYEVSVDEDFLWVHVHTNFERLVSAIRARGYRLGAHKSCMVFSEQRSAWPHTSDALLIRPWWS